MEGLGFHLMDFNALGFFMVVFFRALSAIQRSNWSFKEAANEEQSEMCKCGALMLPKGTLKRELIKLEWPPKAKLQHKA